jgi:AraC-like DNA-binding protein
MQQVHRVLREETGETASLSEIAERYGVRALGRFATLYRAFYGESPSATLRRGSLQSTAELAFGRPRAKF